MPAKPLAEIKRFICQIFTLDSQGEVIGVITYPAIKPSQDIVGTSLTDIKKHLEKPIDTVLNIALQRGECAVILRVSELEQFKAEQAKAIAMQNLQTQIARNSVFASDENSATERQNDE
jgi:hypothetical protein